MDATTGALLVAALSVIATPTGVAIAYSRPDEANGGAPNAFMRTLDRLGSVPRRRAAR